jgi:ribosome-binding factor A
VNISEELLKGLNAMAPRLRYMVTQRVRLKFSPTIIFRPDQSFEEADHIETILSNLDDI